MNMNIMNVASGMSTAAILEQPVVGFPHVKQLETCGGNFPHTKLEYFKYFFSLLPFEQYYFFLVNLQKYTLKPLKILKYRYLSILTTPIVDVLDSRKQRAKHINHVASNIII